MCLRYSVKEMLHFTMMCVWGTEWVKCYCIQWCAYLSYKARKILLCSMMCVWDTLRGKCYSLQWCVWFTGWENFYSIELCVSEVEGEGNFTVYIDVSEVQSEWIISVNIDLSHRYRVRENYCLQLDVSDVQGEGMLLYKMICLSKIQGEEFVTVYNYVCLRYILREILLYTLICIWGTV